MKKIFFPFLGVLMIFQIAVAQDTAEYRKFTFDIGVGGVVSSFQDLKYSQVHWRGIGITPVIGLSWQKKAIHSIGVEGIISYEKPKTFDGGETKVYWGSLFYKYLHPIKDYELSTIYLGGKIEPIDVSFRFVDGLVNNSSYVIAGTNIKAVAMLDRKLTEKWTLKADIAFQLFSYLLENMSFAYAASQYALENGEYNYNEIQEYYSFLGFWKYLNIETNINFMYGERWVFGYLWRMQQSYAVKDYTMTRGYSALLVKYNIVVKNKMPKAKKHKSKK